MARPSQIKKQLIADILQDQFTSVFSVPDKSLNYQKYLPDNPRIDSPLTELQITNGAVIRAINEIKASSSCPKHDIPAKVFKECKNTLCTPLTLFWKKSIESGQIPQCYKNQLIIPLHKKGLKTKAENFRPVTLSSHDIKIFERVVRNWLVNYLEGNSIFSSNQHGFRRGHSCSTQLLSYSYNIFNNSVEGNDTDCVYLDYSKAFDKVDHEVLLNKLRYYNIPELYLNWFKNFLDGRKQSVYLNGSYSYSSSVQSGVPQGSVLGPLFFIIYINDLPNIIHNSRILTYADDTKIISDVRSVNDTINLQNDLNRIVEWSKDNNMKLNSN